MGLYEQDIELIDINGNTRNIQEFKGKTLLIVNTASKCGFTKQFEGLENLYELYHDKDFEILGFPCNQFKEQDPASDDEINSFCKLNYGVTFPMFSKIDVNGDTRHPLYTYLLENSKGRSKITWNFEKFLVDNKGNILNHYLSIKTPKGIAKVLEKIL